ncbi:TIGR02266 family protein [Archangium gephyra]|uniref:TIGR02266 family protein n=1 Tax=Archangium gephyra TaxID=48 RepID=UPI003B796199
MTVEPKLLPLRIRLPYATEEDFVEKYGSNVARGGLFIATRSPKPEGTGLAFELVLADGGRLLRGEGVVVKSQAEGARAGMTVRFVRLDAYSKALIDRIVTRRQQGSEGAARTGDAAAGVPTLAPEQPSGQMPEAGAAAETPRANEPAQEPSPRPETPPAMAKRGRPVISAEALRKQAVTPRVAAPEVPAAQEPAPPVGPPAAPKQAMPKQQAAPRPAAPKPAATGTPATPTPPGPAPAPRPQAQAPATPKPAQPRAPEPKVPPAPAQAAPPASAKPAGPSAPPRTPSPKPAAPPPPEAVAPPSALPAQPEVPATPKPAAPAAPPPAPEAPAAASVPPPTEVPAAPARPTTQDLLANAVLDHLSPDEELLSPESITLEPEPPAPPTAPANHEASAPTPPPEAPARPEIARELPPPAEEPRRSVSADIKGRRRAILDVPVSTPVTAAIPEVVLGIDLGTSQVRVAVRHQGTLQLIPLGEARSLPALLAVDASGQLLVGAAARAEAERSPRHAVHGLRRFLGLRARSPLVRALGGPLPFPISAGPRGDASIELHGRGHLLPELAARLLRELKSATTAFLGHEATRAVLCVPAHFDDRQRAAMREAGSLAGLDVLRILNAPSAAALAFGHERGLARKRLLVVEPRRRRPRRVRRPAHRG